MTFYISVLPLFGIWLIGLIECFIRTGAYLEDSTTVKLGNFVLLFLICPFVTWSIMQSLRRRGRREPREHRGKAGCVGLHGTTVEEPLMPGHYRMQQNRSARVGRNIQ